MNNPTLDALADLKVFQEKFEREHPDLAAEAREEVTTSIALQEFREEYIAERRNVADRAYEEFREEIDINKRPNKEAIELNDFGKKFEREHPEDAALEREEIRKHEMSPEERQAEKLVDRYYEAEERYHDLKENGGSRFSTSEAKDRMERCTYEICKSSHVMNYLHENDRELFDEMNEFKEQEKTLELQREMQRGFEMEL